MGRLAVAYYRQGYNCSQCILLAAKKRFCIPISDESLALCAGINNGFGINGICSVLVAAIMVFGLLFDCQTVKRLRIVLLNRFHCTHNGFTCGHIQKQMDGIESCEEIIAEVADLVEEIIVIEQKNACPCQR